MIINHTDCGLMRATEKELHEIIEKKAGLPANSPVQFHAFKDVEQNVREQMRKLNAHSWIQTDRVTIRGFVFDVHSGRLSEVKD
jgi:carbonic anhydrase